MNLNFLLVKSFIKKHLSIKLVLELNKKPNPEKQPKQYFFKLLAALQMDFIPKIFSKKSIYFYTTQLKRSFYVNFELNK